MKYYHADPEAQPFKTEANHKPRMHWRQPSYVTLDETSANAKRADVIVNQTMVDSIERLSKIIGPDAAGKYFGKFFENLKLEEITPGHYEIK